MMDGLRGWVETVSQSTQVISDDRCVSISRHAPTQHLLLLYDSFAENKMRQITCILTYLLTYCFLYGQLRYTFDTDQTALRL